MEMFDLRQVIPTKKSTSPVTEYRLEITTTDHDTGLSKVFRYTDLHHSDLSFMRLWLQNQVQALELENANRVVLTIGDEITLKVEK